MEDNHLIQGVIPPSYLGRSYIRFDRAEVVFILIPFNFPAKWVRNIYWRFWRFFKKGPDAEMRYFARIKTEHYERGRCDGISEGREKERTEQMFNSVLQLGKNAQHKD